MTIEKEAEDCVYPENNPMDAFWKSICDEHPCIGEELESIRFRITKALQKKQERIEELEQESKSRMDQIVYLKAELRRCYDKINELEAELNSIAKSEVDQELAAIKEVRKEHKKALDRIDELENELRAYDLDIYGADGAKEISNMRKRIAELESALKQCVSTLEFVSMKMGHTNDSIHVCSVCPKIDSSLDRAKKAIGGGNEGD